MENQMGANFASKIKKESMRREGVKPQNTELMAEESALTSQEKIEKIYTFHKQSLVLATRLLSGTNNQNDAEDVVTEAYLAAIKFIDKFQHNSTLSTWFYRVVVNEALQFLRAKTAKRVIKNIQMPTHLDDTTGELKEIEFPDAGSSPEEIVIDESEKKLLDAALEKLPSTYREAILMTEFEGMSVKDAANMSGISVVAHKSRKYKGMKRLRAIMTGEDDGEITIA